MRYGEFDVYIDDTPGGKLEIFKSGLLTCFTCSAHTDTPRVMRLAADLGDRYETIGVMMPGSDGVHLTKYFTKNDLYIKNLEAAQKYLLINSDTEYPSAVIQEPQTETVTEAMLEAVFQELPINAEADINSEDTTDEPGGCQKPEGVEDISSFQEGEEEANCSPLWMPCVSPQLLFNDREAGKSIAGCQGVLTAEKDDFTYVAVPVDPGKPFPAMPIFYFGSQGTYNGKNYLVFQLKDGQLQI